MVDLKNAHGTAVVRKRSSGDRRNCNRNRNRNDVRRRSGSKTMFKLGNKSPHILEEDDDYERASRFTKPQRIGVAVLLVLIVLCFIVAILIRTFYHDDDDLQPPNPTTSLPPSPSKLRMFRKAAVCSDGAPCAKIGESILKQDGSAVDAVIATAFCNGLVNMQSMGMGGGFFMTVYIKEDGKAMSLDARETAPLRATLNMYKDTKTSKEGILATGVPGELKGYWAAHQRYGKLSWQELIQPTIELCENGYNMTKAQYDGLLQNPLVKNDSNLKEWFFDEKGKLKREGSLIKPIKLCKTLKIVAEEGALDFYNGTLAELFVNDIKKLKGIITKEDLLNYTAIWRNPISESFRNGDVLYSSPPPASGILLAFILRVLDGYNFTSKSIQGIDNQVLTYHRMIEAFKYAYAQRTQLGDLAFVNLTRLIGNLTSFDYAKEIRSKINDDKTSNSPNDYGAVFFNNNDHGTAHISVIAQNGDAVSLTSSVNYYFGSGLTSQSTGIILNTGMDDFSYPNFKSMFGLPGSPNNVMAPGKRALSSMSPSIIVDKAGDVKMVVGASGGTRITTAVAQVIMRTLWFGQNVKEAVDAPRLHHQIFPMKVRYEYGTLQQIVDGLEKKGHITDRYTDRGSIICALVRNNSLIFANADYRKGGDVYGFD